MKKSYADLCLERAEKATEGPWQVSCLFGSRDLPVQIDDREDNPIIKIDQECINPTPNCEFIAHARTDVPTLSKLLNAAIAKLRELECPESFISTLEYPNGR